MAKIKSCSVVGYRTFEVGKEYNGRTLTRIEDNSLEFPDSIHVIYVGLDSSDARIFETDNAPVVVEYAEE